VSDNVATWVGAIGQVRAVGRGNLAELRAVRDHLRTKGIADRSLVRILDALLWVSSPGTPGSRPGGRRPGCPAVGRHPPAGARR